MTIKTALVAFVLATTPAVSMAVGGCSERDHQAQSCAPGTVWDAGQQLCVDQASS
ncbi:hypothetical protein [Pukyongiella litopenaei]|uniref:hypothetical protein n=1 Tax=Pukyongiella litopenaei TaxID=2605946 RepID=UPI001B8063AD|nr:hypothetical protein [Pukyongiella litopenaei]